MSSHDTTTITADQSREQYVTITGGHKIYTNQYGDMTSGITVLLINGGPGYSHKVLQPVYDQLVHHGMRAVVYDQLGCGQSDHPTDTDGTLWTMERSTDEIEEIRLALQLNKFIIYGHSHGSMLAAEYAIKYGKANAQQLQAIILSNASMSFPARLQRIKQDFMTWPQPAQDTVNNYIASTDKQKHQAEFDAVWNKHFASIHFMRAPMPPYLTEAAQDSNQDIVQHMFGAGPFFSDGPCSTWDVMKQLPTVHTRTLLLGSKYDWTPQSNLEEALRLMPNSELYIAPNGSHMAMFDDADNYFNALLPFIKRAAAAQP